MNLKCTSLSALMVVTSGAHPMIFTCLWNSKGPSPHPKGYVSFAEPSPKASSTGIESISISAEASPKSWSIPEVAFATDYD